MKSQTCKCDLQKFRNYGIWHFIIHTAEISECVLAFVLNTHTDIHGEGILMSQVWRLCVAYVSKV
jgi:hypothetical protein